MQTYNNIFNKIYYYENLLRAYNEAKKGKAQLDYVIKFTKNLRENLLQLQKELLTQTYKPEKLTTFIIKDPKLRVISKSIFRDRIAHHAIVQVLEPIFDPVFIYDSYANRIGKGTSKALERGELFLRKVSKNGNCKCWGEAKNSNFIKGYALKADIRKYFETVDQRILLNIIKRKIKDKGVISLIKGILDNFDTKIKGKGMPLGNLTSQFFANVYLNELDQFVKHILKAEYYMRYVDDFMIIHRNKEALELYKNKINKFLTAKLKIQLHPDKTKIIHLSQGVPFVGFRIFYNYKILRKGARRRINARLKEWKELNDMGLLERDQALEKLLGWMAYAVNVDTYYLRKKSMAKFNKLLPADR